VDAQIVQLIRTFQGVEAFKNFKGQDRPWGHIPVKGIGTIVAATHSGTETITDVLYVLNINQKEFKVFFLR